MLLLMPECIGILKLMKMEGLTIFHIKSHLQKYRLTPNISEPDIGPMESTDSMTVGSVELSGGLRVTVDVTAVYTSIGRAE